METTYTMIGADGKQYGPITLQQVRTWISEGRITGETKILRSDVNSWLPAAQYAELGFSPASGAAPPPISAAVTGTKMRDPALARQANSGARWFYWIAGLSLINTFMAMSKAGIGFLAGLGVTQFIDGAVSGMESGGKMVGLVLNLLVVGMFVVFGVFAHKGQNWSYITGLILYFLDAVLVVLASLMMGVSISWLEVGFHAFVLFCIFTGLQANLKLKAMEKGTAG